MAHCKNKKNQNILPQLIHMTLQEGLANRYVIKIMYKVCKPTLEPEFDH
jgi:hypothetical protein